MIRCLSILVLSLSLTGCVYQKIRVQNEYLTPERYASVIVGTPDPHKTFPSVGQKITISWRLKREFKCYDKITGVLQVRYGCGEEKSLPFTVQEPVGCFVYRIMDEEYFCQGGVTTYYIQLFADGEPLYCWRHQLWEEMITIVDEDDEWTEFN